MLIDYSNELVFLAVTKTGTTSAEAGILEHGTNIGRLNGAKLKHLTYSDFNRIRDVLKAEGFRTVAVVRHPLERAASWYKYRYRDALVGHPRSTRGVSFSDFLRTLPPPSFDNRCAVVDEETGAMPEIVFKYENFGHFVEFLKGVYGSDFRMPVRNRSPKVELGEINPEVLERYRDAIDWYEALHCASGERTTSD